MLVIRDEGTSRFIFDVEGTAHADVAFTDAAYDDYCDVELVRGLMGAVVPEYQTRFGKEVQYGREWYEDNKLLGRCSIHQETRECGHTQTRAMINFTGLTMLHHSTIIQLADQVNARLDGIETQLKALTEGK